MSGSFLKKIEHNKKYKYTQTEISDRIDFSVNISSKENGRYLQEEIPDNDLQEHDLWDESEQEKYNNSSINSLAEAIVAKEKLHVIRYWIKVELKEINKKRGPNQETLLHIAARIGNIEIINELLKNGADLKITNNQGQRPSHLASFSGHLNMVQALTPKSETNCFDNNRQTPLHFAAQGGHLHICKWLVKNGAKVLEDGNLISPGDLALDNNHEALAKWLYQRRGIKWESRLNTSLTY